MLNCIWTEITEHIVSVLSKIDVKAPIKPYNCALVAIFCLNMWWLGCLKILKPCVLSMNHPIKWLPANDSVLSSMKGIHSLEYKGILCIFGLGFAHDHFYLIEVTQILLLVCLCVWYKNV